MRVNTKTLISLVIILVHLIICQPALLDAAPSFGTIMPDAGEWIAGFETNLAFEQKVRDYHNVQSNQYFYCLSFGFADWFSFDGKLGAGDAIVKPLPGNSTRYRINFSGGYGWRAKLFEDKKHNIKGIWGFQHASVHPSSKMIDGIKNDIIWDDWQIQALATKKLGNLRPYCGLKWSLLYIIQRIDGNRTRRRSLDHVGLIVGTDLSMNNYTFLNIEGRFLDETALSTGLTIKY